MNERIKKKFRRGLAISLSALMIAGAAPLNVLAAGPTDTRYISNYENITGNYDTGIRLLQQGLMAHKDEIDLSSANILVSDFSKVYFGTLAKCPELFFVSRTQGPSYYSRTSDGNRYVSSIVNIPYLYDKGTADSMLNNFYDAADYYLDQVSDELAECDDDFSKAALLHDELALDAHYESNDTSNYTMMVNKYGLCENYSRIYAYLLAQVGINSEIIDCSGVIHEWTKVRIDGNYYNVDVTWDDPTYDKPGLVHHDNFLVSDASRITTNTNYINNHGLSGNSPLYYTYYESGDKYDGFKFHSYNSKLCKVNGETAVYAVDSPNSRIVKYNYVTDTETVLYTFTNKWYIGQSYYIGAYSGLEQYNGLLYFNTQNAVMSLDPKTGNVQTVMNNTNTSGKNLWGVKLRGRSLYGVFATNANETGTETLMKVLPEKQTLPLENKSTVSAESVKIGEKVTLTGAASGGTAPYKYAFYFRKSGENNWTVKGTEFGDGTSVTLTPGTATTYEIKIVVKDASGKTAEKLSQVSVSAPLTNNSKVSSTNVSLGKTVTLTGAATGGTAPYKYAYYFKKSSDNNWSVKGTEYGTAATASLTPGTATLYDVKINVKDAQDAVVSKTFKINVTQPLTNNSTVSKTSANVGDYITLSGAAAGGKAPYKYAFYFRSSSSSGWKLKGTEYGTASSAALNPGSVSVYDIKINVKDAEGTVKSKTFSINVSNLSNNSKVSKTNAAVGDSITLTGAASGGSGSYKYAFYFRKGSETKWTLKGTEYGTAKTAALNPGTATTYEVMIKVKDTAGAVAVKYFIIDVNKTAAALVNNSKVSDSSVNVGKTVTLTGAASGGTGGYKYAFYFRKGNETNWTLKGTEFSSTSTATLTPGTAASYEVLIKVKDSSGTVRSKVLTVKVS